MWILQAYSMEGDARKEIDLSSRQEWILGRSSAADLTIDWDPFLSRQHLRIVWDELTVTVSRLDMSKNRLLFRGEAVDCCTLTTGEEVLVGSSLFRFINETIEEQQALFYEEISFTSEELRLKTDFKAERHLQILASLPALLENQSSVDALLEIVLQLLVEGITEADGMLTLCDERRRTFRPHQHDASPEDSELSQPVPVKILRHYSRAGLSPPQVSQRLWRRALRHPHGALLHLWDHTAPDPHDEMQQEMTVDPRYDWAFCLPVSFYGPHTHGIYVYGHWRPGDTSQRDRIDADIRFANLLIEITTAVIQARQLDKQRILLEQFLPREVASLMIQEPESTLLEPRECEMTVVFCDVQNFTARAERSEDLLDFLKQISSELECASKAILKYGGVIGDFHGDAVMGFWGWPIGNQQAALQACRAALEIQQNLKTLRTEEADIPHGKMRIGIASGRGLAGKIGTSDQMKVTAFGTVVNRSERLQQIGKRVGYEIIVDRETYQQIPPEALHEQLIFHALKEIEVPGISDPLQSYCLQTAT